MNPIEITFDHNPDGLFDFLKYGEDFSAARFLAMTEHWSEEELEDALLQLEEKQILLDVSDLPKPMLEGEAALRLRQEEQLVRQQKLHEGVDINDPLRLYLEELAATPAQGDLRILAEEAAMGSESAREKLLNLSLSRVLELATQQIGRGVLLLDLIQEGSLGLWQSILALQPGEDFEKLRDRWILSSMAKLTVLQARQRGVGQKLRRALEDYRSVDERLLGDLGRNPTVEEIAEELHITAEEADVLRKILTDIRTVNKAHEEKQPETEDPEEEKHVEDTAYFQMRQRIMELLSVLCEADQQLLTLRFGLEGGLPLSPEETGKKLGLTAEEVVQREAAALMLLRQEK